MTRNLEWIGFASGGKPKSKKVPVISESEEDFSSEKDVRIAKNKILKKDFIGDARRPRSPSPPPSETHVVLAFNSELSFNWCTTLSYYFLNN